jgi:Lon protease-like protein
LFPHMLLPLQIFEPRYRQLTADALEGERLIAMGLMRSGWERLPAAIVPPIHRMVGLGKIIAHEKLDDGRYYLVLRGLARASVLSEQLVDLPYRIGQLEICTDILDKVASFDRQDRAEELTSLFVQLFPQVNLQQLFLHAVNELPLATVCDVLLGSIPMAPMQAQQFLEELNIDVRSQMLLDWLEQASHCGLNSVHRTFPPGFSTN